MASYDGSVTIGIKGDDSDVKKTLNETKAKVAKLAAEYKKQGLSASEAFKKAWSEIERESKEGSEKSIRYVQNIGASFEGLKTAAAVGLKAIAAAGAALAGLGAYAIKTGIEFESAFAGVKKTVEATDAQLAALESGIRGLSKNMPQSASAIAGVAEAAGQLGIQTDNILGFTESMVMLGDATNMSADEAATTLARFANVTGMSQNDFDRLGSTIVALGNNMATTESEIAAMAMRISGAGTQVGMTEAQILSFSAALSSVGIEAEAGGSSFSTLISKMNLAVADGEDALKDYADVAGMTAGEFKEAFETNAAGAIQAFIAGLSRIGDEGGSAIQVLSDMGLSEIRIRDALLRAAGASDLFSEAMAIGNEAWEENAALANEAGQRYQTVESRIGMLKNAVDDLAISFYQDSRSGLVGALDFAKEAVAELGDAFSAGGVSGMVKALGDVGAEAAVKLSDAAPDMVEAAGALLSAFLEGIRKNAGKLSDAAIKIGKVFISELSKIIPQAVQTAGKILKSFADELGKAVPVIKPLTEAVGFLSEHLDELAVAAVGVIAALKYYTVIESATKAVMGMSAAYQAATVKIAAQTTALGLSRIANLADLAALTTKEVVVGALTGKIGLATAAQYLWNAAIAANPIGLTVVAITGLIGVLGLLSAAQEKNRSEASKSIERSQERLEAIREERDAYEELKTVQRERAEADLVEIDNAERLYKELQNLTDENGNVQEADAARARFILGELNKALGMELEMTGNQIQNYQDLQGEIYKTITAKRAEILLASTEEVYTEALKTRNAAMMETAAAQREMEEAQKRVNEAEAEYESFISERGNNLYLYEEERAALDAKVQAEKRALAETKQAYDESLKVTEGYFADVAVYEQASADLTEGNTEAVIAALDRKNASFIRAKDVAKESAEKQQQVLDEQYQNALVSLKLVRDGYEKGMEGFTEERVKEWEQYAKDCKAELETVGGNVVEGMISGIESKKGDLKKTADSLFASLPEIGKQKLGIHSPSRVFREQIGRQIPLGVAEGIKDGQARLSAEIRKMSNIAYMVASENAGSYGELGELYAELMAEGIDSKVSEVEEAAQDIVDKYVDSVTETFSKKKQKDLRDQFSDFGKDMMDSLGKVLSDSAEEAKEIVSEKVRDMAKAYQEEYDRIIGLQEDMERRLTDYGDLYTFDDESGEMVLSDLDENIDALDRYDEALGRVLEKLQDRGLSEEFMSILTDMDVGDATIFADKLLEMGDDQFDEYINNWKLQQDKAKDIAAKFYADELAALDEDFSGKLDDALKEVPKLMEDIGKNSMEGWITGMEEKEGELYSAVRSIANEMLSALRDTLDINSPSRKMYLMVGEPAAAGVEAGFLDRMKEAYQRMQESINMETARISGAVTISANRAAAAENTSVHTVVNNSVIERTPVIKLTGELAALARILTPEIRMEERRLGGSLIGGET